MPFQPGQSGNPGGRPKVIHEVRELAQRHCTAAIERLAQAMLNPDDRVAVAAATALLDRAVGKPTQATELSGPGGESLGPVFSNNEIARRIALILHDELKRQRAQGKVAPIGHGRGDLT